VTTFDPAAVVPLGGTGLSVTSLGFGAASIGGPPEAGAEANAIATVHRAWDVGIRYFDVAPFYGLGNSERRLGQALRDRPRGDFVISTKVGRLIKTDPLRPVFDFSRDGVLHSVEESLSRLGLDRIDILLIHDPDDHWKEAIGEAYPTLHRLREQGIVGAIGAGMNQSAMLARFAREGDFDVFLVAGRYTLLDQGALPELLPLCLERGIAVVIGGAMNSGILADPRPGSFFDYQPADPSLVQRALRLKSVCARHGVPLKAAAIQFPLAHPAVASLVAGVGSVDHLDDYPALMRHPIPSQLWEELRAEGLLPTDAPTPVG
jgi:D-threo-aldose 1-dehydrogenase